MLNIPYCGGGGGGSTGPPHPARAPTASANRAYARRFIEPSLPFPRQHEQCEADQPCDRQRDRSAVRGRRRRFTARARTAAFVLAAGDLAGVVHLDHRRTFFTKGLDARRIRDARDIARVPLGLRL